MTMLEELKAICRRHHGLLRAVDVVAYAESPETALHSRFEWDNTKAADAYRLWQARELIRVSVDVVKGTEEPFKVFVSLKDDRTEAQGGYRLLVDVLGDTERRARLLKEALEELATFRGKYKIFKELAPVWAALDQVDNQLGGVLISE